MSRKFHSTSIRLFKRVNSTGLNMAGRVTKEEWEEFKKLGDALLKDDNLFMIYINPLGNCHVIKLAHNSYGQQDINNAVHKLGGKYV